MPESDNSYICMSCGKEANDKEGLELYGVCPRCRKADANIEPDKEDLGKLVQE